MRRTAKRVWSYTAPKRPGRPRAVWLLAGRQAESAAHHLYRRAQSDRAECQYRQDRSGLRQGGHGRHGGGIRGRSHYLQKSGDGGRSVLELPVDRPGDTRAYDARTGAKLWDFHTVPGPGEVGHETWLNDGWKGRSGTNVWAWQMTWISSAASFTCRWMGQPRITTAATGRARIFSATASSQWTPRPES
jgi:hypothetical protein